MLVFRESCTHLVWKTNVEVTQSSLLLTARSFLGLLGVQKWRFTAVWETVPVPDCFMCSVNVSCCRVQPLDFFLLFAPLSHGLLCRPTLGSGRLCLDAAMAFFRLTKPMSFLQPFLLQHMLQTLLAVLVALHQTPWSLSTSVTLGTGLLMQYHARMQSQGE